MFKSLLLASTLALGVSAKKANVTDAINQLVDTLNSSAPVNESVFEQQCHDQCKSGMALLNECQTKQNSHCPDVICGKAGEYYKPCYAECANRTDLYDAFTQFCTNLGLHVGDDAIKVSSATQASGSILAVGAVAVGGALVALF